MTQRSNRFSTNQIALVGVMAALVFISNYLRIPFMDTKLTVANALCAVSGLIFGPLLGFLAAGIGSFLFDLMTGYGAEGFITLVSKGAIALVTGLIAGRLISHRQLSKADYIRIVAAALIGAFTYVALYMLKTWIFGLYVNGLTHDATIAKMLAKLPGSAINAVFATIVAPILFVALHKPLQQLLPATNQRK